MRTLVINKTMSFVDNGKYTKIELEKMKYGFECIYILITKGIVIFLISHLLGILKYTLCFTLFFGLLRMFACGLHASNSFACLIISTAIFIIIPYFCKILILNNWIRILITICSSILIFIYAPADTKKRPIINPKRRLKLKIISITISLSYIVMLFLIKNSAVLNSIMCASILEAIMILPITYKIFKLPYNNYINYLEAKRLERGI